GRAVGLDQMRRVGIDPTRAVIAAGGVAGSVGPGACLAPRETEAVGVQVRFGDGDHAVGVTHGVGDGFGRERVAGAGAGPCGRRLGYALGDRSVGSYQVAGLVGAATIAVVRGVGNVSRWDAVASRIVVAVLGDVEDGVGAAQSGVAWVAEGQFDCRRAR